MLTKYDFLVTEVTDKIVETVHLLQDAGEIDSDLSLREVYNKYLHPEVLPIEDEKIWEALGNVSVINCFQFDSQVGSQVAKKLKPKSIQEMTAANGLMRLMGEEGEERPIDKYAKQKENINLWYAEMRREGLTPQEQKVIEPYFKPDYGVPPDQESLMLMLMDKDICNFSLADRNSARKVVGKKQMNKIPVLKEKVLTQAKSENLGKYIWKHGVGPQMGYAFSRIHALRYSYIGAQTLYLATHWDPIYWNTACLIVNSGSLESTESDSAASTNYEKTAKALGDIINAGIKVSLVDINSSDFGFKPDVENNQILFGMKALLNVNDDIVRQIIANRPYDNPKDFLERIKPGKQAMVSLIKSGAFDKMMDRRTCMGWYLWETCDKKSNLTLQNMSSLIKYNLLPTNGDYSLAKKVYEFNRYLKATNTSKIEYKVDERGMNFLVDIEADYLLEMSNGDYCIDAKAWDKVYQGYMDLFRSWIKDNKEVVLQSLNEKIFMEDWIKYAKGSISAWEMEVLCFYYHEHELENLNRARYGISNFSAIPREPVISSTRKMRGRDVNLFKLYRICGTCIAKNKTKGIVTILTTDGVVNVKFRKEYFSLFDKQISEKGADGKKHVLEKSWFNRGSMIVVTGMRSEDDFISKKYSSTEGHQLYKISKINSDGTLELQSSRATGEAEEEE